MHSRVGHGSNIAREDDVGMGLALNRAQQSDGDAPDQVRRRREGVAQALGAIDQVKAAMRSGGIPIWANEERREQVQERLVALLRSLTVQGIAEADEGELRGDVRAVDFPPESRAQPHEEVSDVIRVRMGEE